MGEGFPERQGLEVEERWEETASKRVVVTETMERGARRKIERKEERDNFVPAHWLALR